jgi:hypothetical protein
VFLVTDYRMPDPLGKSLTVLGFSSKVIRDAGEEVKRHRSTFRRREAQSFP